MSSTSCSDWPHPEDSPGRFSRANQLLQHYHRVTVHRRHMKQQWEGRTVPLHPEAQAALATWLMRLQQLKGLTPTLYVFQSRKGRNQPIGTIHAWKILHEAVTTNELTGKLVPQPS